MMLVLPYLEEKSLEKNEFRVKLCFLACVSLLNPVISSDFNTMFG